MELKKLGPNETQTNTGNGYLCFYSYNTLVAVRHLATGQEWRTSKKHSKTTSKHLNKWCSVYAIEVPQETLEKIGKVGHIEALNTIN